MDINYLKNHDIEEWISIDSGKLNFRRVGTDVELQVDYNSTNGSYISFDPWTSKPIGNIPTAYAPKKWLTTIVFVRDDQATPVYTMLAYIGPNGTISVNSLYSYTLKANSFLFFIKYSIL